MKIVSLQFEIIRATTTVAEFLVHVELDGSAGGHEVVGRALGPRCTGISTVELVYPMPAVDRKDNRASMRCVIPEPNLWTAEMPFTYAVTVELRRGREILVTRTSAVVLRAVCDN